MRHHNKFNPVWNSFIAFLVLAALLSVAPAKSQSAADSKAVPFNEVLKLGDAAPAWQDLPGIDGQTHSLADLAETPVVVVLFTCNTCDTARDYEDRIIAFHKTHCQAAAGAQPRVRLVAINVNKGPDDSLEKMKVRAAARGFAFPYLFDASQKISQRYGALTTPEFYVLDKERRVIYLGAMDDKTEPQLAKENYLRAAVDPVLAGKAPAKSSEPPRGCRIKYKTERELKAEQKQK